MSVQVQVKQGYIDVWFPDGYYHSQGDIFTLSDVAYANLPGGDLAALTTNIVIPPPPNTPYTPPPVDPNGPTAVLAAINEIAPGLPGARLVPANKVGDLSGTYALSGPARPAPGLLWGGMGDSIMNGSNAGNFSYSLLPQACAMVGGLIARPDSFTAGTPGDTSGNMLARFSTFLGYGPQATVILAGTNDASQTIALSTYIANMTSMIMQAKAKGPVILVTVPPRSSGTAAAIHTAVLAENAWIRLYGPVLGCEIADAYSALVDTTSGYLAAAYDSGDGVHPTETGHYLIAVEVAKAMKRVAARNTLKLVTSVQPSGNLIADPLNARATPVTTWFEWPGGTGTAPTYTMVNDTSGVLPAGRWAQMDFDGTASGGVRRLSTPSLSTGFAVGDVLALVAQFQVEDPNGTWVADVMAGTAQAGPSMINQAGAGISGFNSYSKCPGLLNSSGFYDIGPTLYPFTVPAGTTSMNGWFNLVVPTGHHYKLRIGAIGVLNLTALGLASLINWGNAPVAH